MQVTERVRINYCYLRLSRLEYYYYFGLNFRIPYVTAVISYVAIIKRILFHSVFQSHINTIHLI